jgi:hypothetical protein
MGFWSVYMGIYGGGGAEAVTDPNDGWIAESRTRLSIPESRVRLVMSESRQRVWIAEDKVQ